MTNIKTRLEDLPWRPVKRPKTALDGDDGVLALEEVDDVEVVYENGVAKFNVAPHAPHTVKPVRTPENVPVSLDVPAPDLPDWRPFDLHPHLLQVLHSKSFTTPTPIQSHALPLALAGRDIIGVAETGSGKTLAYGLPILHRILSHPRPAQKRTPQALVLAPTRELALQVSDHLNAFADTIDAEGATKFPLVSIAALVGGMSAQKQRRILDRGVDVLIATPGRLWDMLEEDDTLAQHVQNLKVLVLDEADRMIETGHFAEMDKILGLTVRRSKWAIEPEASDQENGTRSDDMQTFVFSATLSKDLQHNLKRRSRPATKRATSTLEDLLLRLDFRDPAPEVIDLSPKRGVVATLQESKIECLASEKDAYLYYFLLRYPGRSLVFLSAIDGIRRLVPLLELLHLKVFVLHSQLEQRQRLKNLDRFKSTPNAVLLATDVAARGLDIPAVDHVVHYQVPRTADVFVHRSGRTARAMCRGFSLLMCAPEERRVVRALWARLGREDEIPEMDVELTLLDQVRTRVRLAREIDVQEHRVRKRRHDLGWLRETAAAMEIELDSDVDASAPEDEPVRAGALRAELGAMLARPLVARGVSTRYVTSGSRPVAEDMLAGRVHDVMLGLPRTKAGTDVKKGGEEEEEEWAGIDHL